MIVLGFDGLSSSSREELIYKSFKLHNLIKEGLL